MQEGDSYARDSLEKRSTPLPENLFVAVIKALLF